MGEEERDYGCVAVHDGEVEGKTTGTIGFVGIEVVFEEDGEDGGVASVRGNVQNGHGVIVSDDFGVDEGAARWAGVVAAVTAAATNTVAFTVCVAWRVCSVFWRRLGYWWWNLGLETSVGGEVTLRL